MDDQLLARVVSALGGTCRPSQEKMVAAVARTVAAREVLLVQAGTGTGKSIGYLVPLVAAQPGSRPAVVSTATLALQRQLLQHDLPAVVAASGGRVSYALLKGRGNYLCSARLAGGDMEESQELNLGIDLGRLERQAVSVREWADRTKTGDRDDYPGDIDGRVWRSLSATGRECVGPSHCAFAGECFSERARGAAANADIVVTNHAVLALDAMERSQLVPEHATLVIDEAHELVARMTSAATVELTPGLARRSALLARGLLPAQQVDPFGKAIDALESALLELEPTRFTELPESVVDPVAALRDAAHLARSDLAGLADGDNARRHRAVAAVDEVHAVAGRLLSLSDSDIAWVGGASPGLSVAPLSVSSLIADSLLSSKAAILTSATLTLGGDFDAIAADLGLGASGSLEWTGIDVGTSFDYKRQGMLYVGADLPRPGRDGPPDEAIERISELIEAADGRTLVLLSSWRAVDRVGAAVGESAPSGVTVMVQRRGEPVGRQVEEFRTEERSVLIGTMSLFQGVDVPGSSCLCVIMDRIPFARPDDPIMQARSACVDSLGGSGFMSISVPRAALLLAQGAGRLIRRDDDFGVFAILDPRIAQARYSGFLLRSLPPFWRTTDKGVAFAALARLAAGANSALVPSVSGIASAGAACVE
ncbi:MAG: ATP-dependent DNA helicase [Candidatus Nanopelagicales bacterium]|nr:ATP-dependent DNA helicase [Candidatus Nanopelagicales bacterium]